MFVLYLNNSDNILLSRSLFQRKARGSDDHWIKTKLSENAVDQSVEVGDVSVGGKWKAILSVSGMDSGLYPGLRGCCVSFCCCHAVRREGHNGKNTGFGMIVADEDII